MRTLYHELWMIYLIDFSAIIIILVDNVFKMTRDW